MVDKNLNNHCFLLMYTSSILVVILESCITLSRNRKQIKVYTDEDGILDNPPAKAYGTSPRTGGQTEIEL